MNYAALLALLAALAFTLPFLVNLAAQLGIARGYGIVTSLAVALFLLGWLVVRGRVARTSQLEARIAVAKAERRRAPEDVRSFFCDGEHVGDLLIEVGRPREALRVFEGYLRLLEPSARHERAITTQVISSLRRELAEQREESREEPRAEPREQEEMDARV